MPDEILDTEAPSPVAEDIGDAKAVSDRKARLGRRQKRVDDGLRLLLESQSGRLWLWDLLESCHCFASPFQPGQPDSSAFRCGEQNVGLRLIAQITRVQPDAFILMMKENSNGN